MRPLDHLAEGPDQIVGGDSVGGVGIRARAQSDVSGLQDGIVAEADTAAGVVTLEDGRRFRRKPGTEIVYKGYWIPLGALRPGNYITISGAEPVVYRDGRYVPISEN